MTDEILERMWPLFEAMYAEGGRPSIPPEKLRRAQLLQMLYSVRSERLLMEEIDYSILHRWFVGLNLDEKVWDATTFTKNRDRLLDAAVAQEFLAQVLVVTIQLSTASQDAIVEAPGYPCWRSK
jgi:transposase